MKKGLAKEYLKGTRRGRRRPEFPIEEFLKKRIGKFWDKVYQEASDEFDKRTRIGRKFFQSLGFQVELHCYIENKIVYRKERDYPVMGFYVHPKSGCLQYARPKESKKVEEEKTFIKLDDNKAYVKKDGIWYYCTYKLNDYYSPYYLTSISKLSKAEREIYGRKYNLEEKKQLNKEELKELGLVNDSNQ